MRLPMLSAASAGRSLHSGFDSGRYTSAVSLHSHTWHSRESLDFIPRVVREVPAAWSILRAIERRHRGDDSSAPYERCYWRPPLTALAAYRLEAGQIRRALGLKPLVSITDHDDIEACAELNAMRIPAPYSVEWTVPYHGTVFHLGVHNMPSGCARDLQARMARVTARFDGRPLSSILADLDAMPRVLTVLNHPLSNERLTGLRTHYRLLKMFLRDYGCHLHAFEYNGLQPREQNAAVVRMAKELGLPVVSGGDRHCAEPNAILNLTQASTITEFVEEVRRERRSEMMLMPQYSDPIPCRYIQFAWEVVRAWPDFAGHERWTDRVFQQTDEGDIPISQLWPGGGGWPVRSLHSLIGLLASPGLQAALRAALGRPAAIAA
jgi:hypothetical protein